MKAAVYNNYGSPEVVRIAEVQNPVPKEDEVLIKVYASTVNRTDCGFRSAEYFISRFFSGLFRPKYKVLGNEFAGEIIAVGKNVAQYKTGERVFGYNDKSFGAHAEYMVMRENDPMAHMPKGFNYEQCAPVTEGAHYALCDIRAVKIKPGDKVLINGATGAIGSSAVQLCKYFGAHVTAVCSTENTELVASLGADKIIDYRKSDFTLLKEKFDFVFDAVGKSSFGKCKPLLKPKGIYISTELGYMCQNPFLAMITSFSKGKRLLFPIPTIHKEDVLFLKELLETRKFKPVIDRTYSLENIVEAYHYVETGQKTGNVVINISH